MKLKRISVLLIAIVLMLYMLPGVKATEDSQEINLTTENALMESDGNEETNKYVINPQLIELGLDVPQMMDEKGSIPIPQDRALLNILIPQKIGETVLFAIGPNAFDGITCLRSITIPSTITQIGSEAFANCSGLEYIVLQDRFNLEGLTLGENWNGNATVIFGLVQETSSTESTEETVEPSDPKQELPYASSSELADIDTTSSEDIDGMISGENAETNS
ncbi:MAG: hypothetical protein EOM34_09045 [Clostridia bacterium]|nr:hypothetical protein [Clostridia bacterium]